MRRQSPQSGAYLLCRYPVPTVDNPARTAAGPIRFLSPLPVPATRAPLDVRDRAVTEAGLDRRIGAVGRRNPADSQGQQQTPNLKVSGCFAGIHLHASPLGRASHSRSHRLDPCQATSANRLRDPSRDAQRRFVASCQQVVSNHPPCILASHNDALSRILPEQGRGGGERGG